MIAIVDRSSEGFDNGCGFWCLEEESGRFVWLCGGRFYFGAWGARLPSETLKKNERVQMRVVEKTKNRSDAEF